MTGQEKEKDVKVKYVALYIDKSTGLHQALGVFDSEAEARTATSIFAFLKPRVWKGERGNNEH